MNLQRRGGNASIEFDTRQRVQALLSDRHGQDSAEGVNRDESEHSSKQI